MSLNSLERRSADAVGCAGSIREAVCCEPVQSFLDRNRAAYTSWAEIEAGAWQTVQIAFDTIRPNPYFQPPGAKTDNPIDVSEVVRIGLAPQGQTAGLLAISRFVVD